MTLAEGGVTVAVHSAHASRIHYCQFDALGRTEQRRVLLDQRHHDLHHAFIRDVKPGTRYGLRAEGPWQPLAGHRFDGSKLLVDPYATALDRPFTYHAALCEFGRDTAARVPKGIIGKPPAVMKHARPRKPTWIYEVPVKAFTMRHPAVPPEKRGTVAALAEPAIIAHFKRLGVDTIELMPLVAWIDERHLAALGLSNAWGYNPVNFMAPDPRLAPGGFAEIAATVKTLHETGVQVLLDVVLNHTGESDAAGPSLCFRGLDNALYYRHIHGAPVNDSGCGNTVALDHPRVADYALAALRMWVEATGIDGFRFDLATVMGRDGHGFTLGTRIFQAIENDPVLNACILIAEPWDVGPGGYQLGNFPTDWLEWNDKFRDDVRRFWRGDAFSANDLATRLAGSSDIFAPRKSPSRSINFVAAHDGFTLADLTRYASKDNMANGEGNRDGKFDEVTWLEGDVNALLATLFLSRGTPMLTAGDEFGRSQGGNNNAYAQDNDTTWLQWTKADRTRIEAVAVLTQLRKDYGLLAADSFLTGAPAEAGEEPDVQWYGEDGHAPHWSNPQMRFLTLALSDGKARIALAFNGNGNQVRFPLEPRRRKTWKRIYCSAKGPQCPPHSVSLYAEISA